VKFSEVMGQEHVTETLARAVETDNITHAYLFHGPRGTGKTSTARILAKRVTCLKPDKADPCGKCPACQAFEAGRQMDIMEIDAASNRGVDDIRALRETVNTVPTLGKYKIYIIDEAHMLTNEASTALLKTLEEPVKHVIFILATTELHKVLPTILSRCQVYRFRRADREEMTSRLRYLLKAEGREADEAVIDFIIDRSDGCYRDAESLLGQVLTMQAGEVTKNKLVEFLGLPADKYLQDFLKSMIRGESAPALSAVGQLLAEGVDPEQFLREVIRTARDGAVALVENQEIKAGSFEAENNALARLPIIIRTLLQATQDLAYVPQPALAIHLAILTVCRVKGEVNSKHQAVRNKKPDAPSRPRENNQPVAVVESPRSVPVSEEAADSAPPPGPDEIPQGDKDKGGVLVEGNYKLADVEKVWPALIEQIKSSNPVASTFLRAVRPQEVSGNTILIEANYGLHRNFFEGSKNKQVVADKLSDLLGGKVKIKMVLNENGNGRGLSLAETRQQKEDELMRNVKEVFGG